MSGAPISYALAARLPHVLADETNGCLYGNGRVGGEQAGGLATLRRRARREAGI